MLKKFTGRGVWQILLSGAVITSAFAVGMCPAEAYAQSQGASQTAGTIRGEVVDDFDEPLIGATVMVKGTTVGTATDFDGKFEIKAKMGDMLEIRYIGYKSQTVKVDSDFIRIKLVEDPELLDEVVVVGYGTQKKATMTGADPTRPDEVFIGHGSSLRRGSDVRFSSLSKQTLVAR